MQQDAAQLLEEEYHAYCNHRNLPIEAKLRAADLP